MSVPVARWLGERLTTNEEFDEAKDSQFGRGRWPRAAWGHKGDRAQVDVSAWPVNWARPHLLDFLQYEGAPLSERATAGFLSRASRGNLRIPEDFLREAYEHLDGVRNQQRLIAV